MKQYLINELPRVLINVYQVFFHYHQRYGCPWTLDENRNAASNPPMIRDRKLNHHILAMTRLFSKLLEFAQQFPPLPLRRIGIAPQRMRLAEQADDLPALT